VRATTLEKDVTHMKAKALLIVLACIFCWSQAVSAVAANSDPTITVRSGKLRGGVTADGGAVFKGIPFAQPPVGDHRWQEPVPATPWTGVREATAFGANCVQGGNLAANSSEDCLYLNVWTPKWPMTAPAAVMVWIHGGGNFAGAGSEPIFNGENLARHGVVLVTVNYRLGVFGFLAHPELTKESAHHVSGNYGLLDQVLALRWVHDNIAKFGGNPANVTIFGESAGSLDINVLMTSPLSKGLYQRVIGESGPVVAPPPLAEAEKKGEELAAKLNLSGDAVLPKLRAISSADLQKETGQGLAFLGPTLGVNVDGYLFPEPPMKAFLLGHQQHVGLLLGSNSQELQRPFFPMTGGLRKAIAEQFGTMSERALALYSLSTATEPVPDPQLGTVMAQWATDTQFRCGSVAELVWHTNAQNPGYQFQFSRSAPEKEALGAAHGSEVAFVFGTLDTQSNPPRYTEADHRLSEAMQQYWTNFAKTGDPNGESLPKWSRFDAKAREYMELTNSGAVPSKDLRAPVCELYREMLEHKAK
jgi:para-nitrobenzyl esterase